MKSYLYADLTWPEINEAAKAKKVLLLPIGSTEQHGHHLPLDTDNYLATSVSVEAAKRDPENMLVMPNIPYGYNEHAMDFPGTIHVHYDHFIEYCLDVCKSVAYYGFERIVLVDGHGSNEHLCEFIARRGNLETDALFASCIWVDLAKEKFDEIRDSGFGGAAHAGELETSTYLHLDDSRVDMSKATDHYGGAAGGDISSSIARFTAVDLSKGWGPMKVINWTSSASPTGVSGAATMATKEKGEIIFNEAVDNLVEFVRLFKEMPKAPRVDHREVKPASPTLPSLD
jgi:creatinine amidohydrolase